MKRLLILTALLTMISCGSTKENSQIVTGGNQGTLTDWYYVPGTGTIKGDVRPYSPPIVSKGSLQHDVLVLSDLSGRIDYINKDGSIKWSTHTTGTRLTDMQLVDENTFSYGENGSIVFASLKDGQKINTIKPINNLYIRGYKKIDDNKFLVTSHQNQSVNVFMVDRDNNILWQDLELSNYPRSVDHRNNVVVVADTFGHRVYAVDLMGNKIFEFEEYYPNEVQYISDTKILVTGEHQNRVFIYDVNTGSREYVFSCKNGIYNDKTLSLSDFLNIPADQKRQFPGDNKSKGICADDFNQNNETLYSPNGAYMDINGDVLISDTDNHRVLIIRNGESIVEITNFDNPVDAIYIK